MRPPGPRACPLCLFDVCDDWGRRQLGRIDLLGVMMEAAAQGDGRRDDGKSNNDAHDLIPLTWHLHSIWVRETLSISPRYA